MQWRVLFLMVAGLNCQGAELFLEENFKQELQPGWKWVRENPSGWKVGDGELLVWIQPGNMWGGANNAKNVLVRPVPDPAKTAVEISVRVENRPTAQYEQVDLVWYYDDSHMVKIGQELVDGKLSIVMGREENDRTRTIAIIPLDSEVVWLRQVVRENTTEGFFRKPGDKEWRRVGQCDLPIHGDPHVSLQFYQGPSDATHWAKIKEFKIKPFGP